MKIRILIDVVLRVLVCGPGTAVFSGRRQK
jgi:hypothetical protein